MNTSNGWLEKKLWLDDIRNCPEDKWATARNYKEFVEYIKSNGVPDYISFDHDLGYGEKTGYDCALYLVMHNIQVKDFSVHSSNPIGAKKIIDLLNDWREGIKPAKLNWQTQ